MTRSNYFYFSKMKCFCCFYNAGLKTTVAHENVTMTGWHCYQCANKAKERLHEMVRSESKNKK